MGDLRLAPAPDVLLADGAREASGVENVIEWCGDTGQGLQVCRARHRLISCYPARPESHRALAATHVADKHSVQSLAAAATAADYAWQDTEA